MFIRKPRRTPALAGARHHRLLKQVGLDNILKRVAFLAHGGRDGFDADGTAVVYLDDRPQKGAILFVEPAFVDLRQLQGLFRDWQRELSVAFDGGEVARSS